VSGNFTNIVVADFEYEITDGDLPNVLCMVAHVLDENLQHVHTIKLWRGVASQSLPPIDTYRGDFGREPPFDVGPDTLFVAYSAWAEMTCFQMLGWKFPVHTFDLHTAYLATSNMLLPYNPDEKRKRPGKGLPDACRAYGIAGWEHIDKKTIAKDIGEGRWHLYAGLLRGRYQNRNRTTSTAIARLRFVCPGQRPACSALVELQRQMHRANPSPRNADRHGAVGVGAREQESGHCRANPPTRYQPDQ
jgi:hypothetical protein